MAVVSERQLSTKAPARQFQDEHVAPSKLCGMSAHFARGPTGDGLVC